MNFPQIKKFSLLTESETVATDHTIPTHSQLKIDGTLIVPEGEFPPESINHLNKWINSFLCQYGYKFDGNISPLNPDAESFMVEIERTKLQGLKNSIALWEKYFDENEKFKKANDKAYSDLAEQLRQEKENKHLLAVSHLRIQNELEKERLKITRLETSLDLIVKSKRDELKDSPIKAGLKRIWKWFKSTVNQ